MENVCYENTKIPKPQRNQVIYIKSYDIKSEKNYFLWEKVIPSFFCI